MMNKSIEKELNNYVNAIIIEKSLHLSSIKYSFNQLIDAQILKVENEKYIIKDFSIFVKPLISEYKKKNNYELEKDFSENLSFIKKLIKDLNISNFQFGIDLFKEVIIYTHKNYNYDFNEFISNLDKQRDTFLFVEAYSRSLLELNLQPETFIKNAEHIIKHLKSDGVVNILYKGIIEKCNHNYEYGIKLFETSLKIKSNANITSAIITGLYNNKGKEFYDNYLKKYIDQNEHLTSILNGLSNIDEIKQEEFELFLELFDRYNKNDKFVLERNILLISLIANKQPTYNINPIFERLSNEIKIEKVATIIIQELSLTNNYNDERINLLIKFIKQPFFDINKHIQIIDRYFFYIKDIKLLKQVLESLAEYKEFEHFAGAFHSLRNFEKKDLDKLLIDLLISDKASVRFVGNDIFNEFSFDPGYIFSFDIIKLQPIEQYKLWVSITQSFREPKYTIPALLRLLNSSSNIVKESFISKLEILTEEYGSLVIEVLEKNLDLTKQINQKILSRVKNYMDNFYKTYIIPKSNIKEFNPYYTQNKHIKLYYDFFNKKMQKIRKDAEKKSLLSKIGASTIKLAKGGGWKFDNKKSISKLSKFNYSFSLPRSYFIDPNRYEVEESIEIRKDWKEKDFQIIKELLINE